MSSEHDSARPADPFELLRREHRELTVRLAALESSLEAEPLSEAALGQLRVTTEHLEAQFSTHMAIEEVVVFPSLAEAFPEAAATLAPLRSEHAELRTMRRALAELLATPPGNARDEQLRVQARDLIDLLRLHMAREDTVAFTVAERVLGPPQWRELVSRIASHQPIPEVDVRRRPPGGKG